MVIRNRFSTKPPAKKQTVDPAKVAELEQLLQQLPPPAPRDYTLDPWNNPERRWYGGDTALGDSEDLYIDDAGNLKLKPKPKKPNPLFPPVTHAASSLRSVPGNQQRLFDVANQF